MRSSVLFILIALLSFPKHAILANDSTGSDLNNKVVVIEKSIHIDEETDENQSLIHNSEKHSEGHHTDTTPLLFIIFSIVIGGLASYGLKKISLPFTVALMLIGFILGLLGRVDFFMDIFDLPQADQSIKWASHIDPHLMLYIFLPILIFEAAFAMDVHIFKKTLVNSIILAVPGIILAMILTAVFIAGVYLTGFGLTKWTWSMAMLFGAVISATDPVAVVAILKELGASKKLGTLIEGESMLNDGTAIVLFLVVFAGISGEGVSDLPAVLIFLKVALGGIAVGAFVSWLLINWIKRVFNEPLVEISAIVGASYVTFFVAENFFGVSGVIALVTLGVIMASSGRTKISPEVQHFLHEFWELAAFLANVMIFIIVGVVIAERIVFTLHDLWVLLAVFVGVFIVRAIVLAVFYPFMKRSGYGMNMPNAIVLWWGALRGAIGLALALIVVNTDSIDQEVRNQFLFLTAGIVMLTLLLNATTMKRLVNKLGLTKLSPAKKHMQLAAKEYLANSSVKAMSRLNRDRFLRKSDWDVVEKFLPKKVIHTPIQADVLLESRVRILEKEKSSYWSQFKDGLLSSGAYHFLTDEISKLLDDSGKEPLSSRADLEKLFKVTKSTDFMQKIPLLKYLSKYNFTKELMVSYDCATGFISAQEECLKLLASMQREVLVSSSEVPVHLVKIQREIEENIIKGLTYIRNLGKEFPEIYREISTRKAIRSLLNYEKHTVIRLLNNGRINQNEADELITDIEVRMKKIRDAAFITSVEDNSKLHRIPIWLKEFSEDKIQELFGIGEIQKYGVDEVIFIQDKKVEGLRVVLRGEVEMSSDNENTAIVTEGAILDKIGGLSNAKHDYSAKSIVPSEVLFVKSKKLEAFIEENPEFIDTLWKEVSKTIALEVLEQKPPYNNMSYSKLHHIINDSVLIFMKEGEVINLYNEDAILIDGHIMGPEGEIDKEYVLKHTNYKALTPSVVLKIKE